jgi:dihydroorotate dehydrogenase
LIAGGGIQNIDDARRVLDTGADAVAIGTAGMKDPGLCGSIQKALRQRETL